MCLSSGEGNRQEAEHEGQDLPAVHANTPRKCSSFRKVESGGFCPGGLCHREIFRSDDGLVVLLLPEEDSKHPFSKEFLESVLSPSLYFHTQNNHALSY
jgi:hypothetical protein